MTITITRTNTKQGKYLGEGFGRQRHSEYLLADDDGKTLTVFVLGHGYGGAMHLGDNHPLYVMDDGSVHRSDEAKHSDKHSERPDLRDWYYALCLLCNDPGDCVVTTDRSESSYNQPVVLAGKTLIGHFVGRRLILGA